MTIGLSLSSPPDAPLTAFDFDGAAASMLEDAGIPDFLADALADLAAANYTPEALHTFGRWAARHIDPIIEAAK